MLTFYLETSIDIIQTLITMTRRDIDAVKNARHDTLQESAKEKERLLASFEEYKRLIDDTMGHLAANAAQQGDVRDLLTVEQMGRIETMKEKLAELKRANKDLGRMVLAVGEFFNSLLVRIAPQQPSGYGSDRFEGQSFLAARG